MKNHSLSVLAAAMIACSLAACSDPSENVHKAATSAPEQTSPGTVTAGKEYVIRAGSKIDFVGSKVTGSHNGGFTNIAGVVQAAGGKISGTPEIKIAMASLWSDNERLTGHLKSPDFFDVQQFPVSTFSVTSIEPTASGHTITGNLDLHGVTKSITFPAKVQVDEDAITIQAEFAINRRDFGINYPGKPNDLIRDNVVIKLDLKATPGPAQPEDKLPV